MQYHRRVPLVLSYSPCIPCPWVTYAEYTALTSYCMWMSNFTSHLSQSQLYSRLDSINQLQLCIAEIGSWMRNFTLKLNGDKTKFIIISMKQQLTNLDDNITICNRLSDISPSESVHNLGFIINNNLTNISHINKLSTPYTSCLRT